MDEDTTRGWLDRQRPVQDRHDARNHSDVTCLGRRGRLVHYALHHGKYAGRLARAGGDEAARRTVTDAVLVCLSAANALDHGFEGLRPAAEADGPAILRGFAEGMGRLAGAVAGQGPLSRAESEAAARANLDVMAWTLCLATSLDMDLEVAVTDRRRELAARAFFADDEPTPAAA